MSAVVKYFIAIITFKKTQNYVEFFASDLDYPQKETQNIHLQKEKLRAARISFFLKDLNFGFLSRIKWFNERFENTIWKLSEIFFIRNFKHNYIDFDVKFSIKVISWIFLYDIFLYLL